MECGFGFIGNVLKIVVVRCDGILGDCGMVKIFGGSWVVFGVCVVFWLLLVVMGVMWLLGDVVVERRVEWLCVEIVWYDELYFKKVVLEISDEVYDWLKWELMDLEKRMGVVLGKDECCVGDESGGVGDDRSGWFLIWWYG